MQCARGTRTRTIKTRCLLPKKTKCKHCGKPMSWTKDKGDVCGNRECPTNKKTKPICRNCQVVMEEVLEKGEEPLYRCPKCGVTTREM